MSEASRTSRQRESSAPVPINGTPAFFHSSFVDLPRTWIQKGLFHFQRLDIFGFEPVVILSFPYRSYLGACVSLFVFSVMIWYIQDTITTWAKQLEFSTSIQISVASYEPIATLPLAMTINYDNQQFYNDSLFRVEYSEVTIREQDALPRTKRTLGTVPCRFTDEIVNALCPNESVVLEGTYEKDVYRYLEIALYKCTCPANSTDCNCGTDEEIQALIDGSAYINLWSIGQSGNITAAYRLSSTFYTQGEAFFKKYTTIKESGVFVRSKKYDTKLYLDSLQTILSSPRTSSTLTKIFVRLAVEDVTVSYIYRTLFDVFGSWGAMFSTLTVTFGTVTLMVNTTFFNRQLKKVHHPYINLNPAHFDEYGKIMMHTIPPEAMKNKKLKSRTSKEAIQEEEVSKPL